MSRMLVGVTRKETCPREGERGEGGLMGLGRFSVNGMHNGMKALVVKEVLTSRIREWNGGEN